MERWIWSATSGIVFRKSVIESFAPPLEQSRGLRLDLGFDDYFARLRILLAAPLWSTTLHPRGSMT